MEEIEGQILALVRQTYQWLDWPGVIVLMAIESASIPLPSEVIMPLSGWMLVKERGLGAAHVVVAGFYGALGCTLGSLLAYWVGARGGRPLLERYGKYLLVSSHDLEQADRWFQRYGSWAVFLSRLLPVVRTFISLPAGVARMPLAKFIPLTFLGSFPWSLGLAYGGYVLGENWESLRAFMRPFDIPFLVAFFVLLGFYLRRHWKRAFSKPSRSP